MSRKELIMMARKPSAKADKHLEECSECRELVELLRVYDVSGSLPLADAPAAWVANAASLATARKTAGKVKQLAARLVFDSWAVPHPVGVRGEGALGQRRMHFKAGRISFDMRAEHLDKGWSFVAQVSGKEESPIILQVGKKAVLSDRSGLFQWSGKRPPKKLSLRSSDMVISLPELAWKRPRSK